MITSPGIPEAEITVTPSEVTEFRNKIRQAFAREVIDKLVEKEIHYRNNGQPSEAFIAAIIVVSESAGLTPLAGTEEKVGEKTSEKQDERTTI